MIITNTLSNYDNKMLNSGHSLQEAKRVIVCGVTTKYLFLLECSSKELSDADYKPLYVGKEYNEVERQLEKYLIKMGWYKKDMNTDSCAVTGNDVESVKVTQVKHENWRSRLQRA